MKLQIVPIDKPKRYINNCTRGCASDRCPHIRPHSKLADCNMTSFYCKPCVEIGDTNEVRISAHT